jgi:putative oxidoreductase
VTTQEIQSWFLARRSWCMDLLRIYLGVGLFVKGMTFAAHRQELVQTMVDHHVVWSGMALAHFVILTHLFGGFLMATGIGTRIGALIQIPTLVGATFFVNWSGGIFGFAEELRFSALVLFLLLLFVWYGNGPLSFESRLERSLHEVVPDATRLRPESSRSGVH